MEDTDRIIDAISILINKVEILTEVIKTKSDSAGTSVLLKPQTELQPYCNAEKHKNLLLKYNLLPEEKITDKYCGFLEYDTRGQTLAAIEAVYKCVREANQREPKEDIEAYLRGAMHNVFKKESVKQFQATRKKGKRNRPKNSTDKTMLYANEIKAEATNGLEW